jgi:hypothetical protein
MTEDKTIISIDYDIPLCPRTGWPYHVCTNCECIFDCKAGFYGEDDCEHIDDDDNTIFCSQQCSNKYYKEPLFDDHNWDDEDDKMSELNRAKFCDCLLWTCCNDKEGCWSPRPFKSGLGREE